MTNKEMADILFPNIDKTPEDYEKMYPERNIKEGAIVSRYAPSPTGFVHMGALFASFIERKMARQTDGIFYLRIEDTDGKRSIENGVSMIIQDLSNYGITFDEGMVSETEWKGQYGPYIQSARREIYHTYIKRLVEEGLAYPCFCKEEELEEIRKKQEKNHERIGYYGKYAFYREFSKEEAISRIKKGDPYVIRLKSPGNFEKKIHFKDLIKGELELPENDLDIVILKGDGLPTYHFAHAVDDHLMRTTHVIRGDEWLSSVPIHIQLFSILEFKVPKYAHISPLMKEEDGKRRKLSKRKDPEMAVSFYHEQGIPIQAILLYLITVANSNFEAWYEQNKNASIDDFSLDFKKISSSGSLFDMEKLLNISKNYLSRLKASEVYDLALSYASQYDLKLCELLKKYKEYAIAIFNIEREQKKPRKDLSKMSEVKEQIWYMFDELFESEPLQYEWGIIDSKDEILKISSYYFENYYNPSDTKEEWFSKLKDLSEYFGYAKEVKMYKENPELYKGHVGDVSMVLRVLLTTKSMTPDLYDIMNLLGKERMESRMERFRKNV